MAHLISGELYGNLIIDSCVKCLMQSHTPFRLAVLSFVALIAVVLAAPTLRSAPTKNSKAIDKAPYPVASAKAGQRTATLAGGCFWSMEAIFKQLKGVVKVEPGYAGGELKNPSYDQVGTGQTGHSEAVNIIYDPKLISFHDLLKVFLTVHDPTTLDKQGADEGPQYRSRIFYRDDAQKQAASLVVSEINKSKLYKAPIVTRIEPFKNFYRAEGYHLDYYNLNPDEGYSKVVIAPKIEKFRTKHQSKLKS
jgi:methionine-S-sulfoxide reductase